MKMLKGIIGGLCLCAAISCTSPTSQKEDTVVSKGFSQSEAVVKTIMERRSIRKYKPQPVNRDTMQTILKCGINAPNGMNKQSWEVRVVDNAEYINGVTELYKKANPKAAEDPSFKTCSATHPRWSSLPMTRRMIARRLIVGY